VNEPATRLLSGIARCGVCATPLCLEPTDDSLVHYVCLAADCGEVWVDAEALESSVMIQVLSRLSAAGIRAPANPEQMADTHRRLKELDAEYAAGRLERTVYLETRREVYDTGEELRRLADQGPTGLDLGGEVTPDVFAHWWAHAPLERSRELLSLLLEYVDVHPTTEPEGVELDMARVTYEWRTS